MLKIQDMICALKRNGPVFRFWPHLMVGVRTAGSVCAASVGSGTFGEGAGVAVHLQGVQGADLQLGVVVQELLHDGLEGQQQLLLLLQLLFGGRRQLLLALRHAQLLGDVLEETGWGRGKDTGGQQCGGRGGGRTGGVAMAAAVTFTWS